MSWQGAITDYERFQQRLFSAIVRWLNVVLVVVILVNGYRAWIDLQNTLFITAECLLMMLIGARSLFLARRGRMRLAVRLYLLSGMSLLALLSLNIHQVFVLNVVVGLCLLVFLGAFLGLPKHAFWWAVAGIVFHVVGLTLRNLLPLADLTYSTADIVGLYLFPALFLGVSGSLGYKLAASLSDSLAQSELARGELSHRLQELHEAQSSLQAINEQLHLDLAERLQIERQLRISRKELHDSLQEKEILLQEVHHRVKNNLQVISSLLDMQSYGTQHPQVTHALQESQSRIRAIAFVHERLYQSPDLTSVDAGEYIHSIADDLFSLYADPAKSIDLRVEADDCRLDLSTAIPCGLIANELISNALKHAFPDTLGNRSGEVRVTLDSRGENIVRLAVGDNGVGLPPGLNPATEFSLGLRLVHMLSEELGGAMEVQTRGGTHIAVTFAR
jgi:two-component sensor histidine kinase